MVRRAVEAGLTSGEHFDVDGTLIDSHPAEKSFRPAEKSFRPADGQDCGGPDAGGFAPRDPDVDFRGRRRPDATRRGAADPGARPM